MRRGVFMHRSFRRRMDDVREKWNESFDTQPVVRSGVAEIELCGNQEAVVDGCQGILQYEDTVIRVSTGRQIVRFRGADLRIRTMQQNQILICGTIASVDFLS